MIKFIACDLDGTLLPPSKVLPDRTFEIIEKLHEKGVIFAPASGRQLPNLLKLFAPVADKIAVIAENGGLGWHGGEIIYSNPTPADSLRYALGVLRGESDLYPLISCADCAYYESGYQPFIDVLNKSYSRAERVESFEDIIDSRVALKISVWDPLVSASHGGVILPRKIKGLRVMVSGYDWLDISVADANKGAALGALLKHFNIAPEECMAFGDHMNDLEMLLACAHPYVTANAFPALKEVIHSEVASNADFGVIKKLEELL